MGPLRGGLKAVLRILALVGKELVEVLRRPGAAVSLILGPFLILAVFGLGYHGIKQDLRAIVVSDASFGLPTEPSQYESFQVPGIRVVGVTADRAAAEGELRAQAVDLVVVAPKDLQGAFSSGQQALLTVEMNTVDPVQANYAGFLADYLVSAVNREIYRIGAQAGEGYAIQFGDKAIASVPPAVIASPTRAAVVNLAPSQPGIEDFFGPAALALVLQHLAVTLLALSIVRERTSGAMDLFRVSPIRATELVIGKVLAYGLLGLFVASISIALIVGLLHVPMLAPVGLVAGVVVLLLLASLGLGLLISVISGSERQAVQLSMLVLLASMFFSGFVLRIGEFDQPVQVAAAFLPVTHGISLLQDLLLRGSVSQPWQLFALAGLGLVLLLTSWALLRREMRPA